MGICGENTGKIGINNGCDNIIYPIDKNIG
jgi:hypothetical protein